MFLDLPHDVLSDVVVLFLLGLLQLVELGDFGGVGPSAVIVGLGQHAALIFAEVVEVDLVVLVEASNDEGEIV